ncbi:hypothetical protein NDU88_000559 [Pleurodeles waltl]|uniref:Uncharacterized protein n=1 Tax=Pleurodeles waltl TaxID=8319 RepID=A0AAV7LWV0_PLEWA|nr:hypothetical protein NDU88_000559 [Pleurodeles waltl]
MDRVPVSISSCTLKRQGRGVHSRGVLKGPGCRGCRLWAPPLHASGTPAAHSRAGSVVWGAGANPGFTSPCSPQQGRAVWCGDPVPTQASLHPAAHSRAGQCGVGNRCQARLHFTLQPTAGPGSVAWGPGANPGFPSPCIPQQGRQCGVGSRCQRPGFTSPCSPQQGRAVWRGEPVPTPRLHFTLQPTAGPAVWCGEPVPTPRLHFTLQPTAGPAVWRGDPVPTQASLHTAAHSRAGQCGVRSRCQPRLHFTLQPTAGPGSVAWGTGANPGFTSPCSPQQGLAVWRGDPVPTQASLHPAAHSRAGSVAWGPGPDVHVLECCHVLDVQIHMFLNAQSCFWMC